MIRGRLGNRLRGHLHGDLDGLVVGGETGTRSGDGGGVGSLRHGGGGRKVDSVREREAEAAGAVEREREPRAAIVGSDGGADLAVGGEAQIAGGAGSHIDVEAGGHGAADLYRDGDGLGRIDGIGIADGDDAGGDAGGQAGGVQGELERGAETGLRRTGALGADGSADPGDRRREAQVERAVESVVRFHGLQGCRWRPGRWRPGRRWTIPGAIGERRGDQPRREKPQPTPRRPWGTDRDQTHSRAPFLYAQM